MNTFANKLAISTSSLGLHPSHYLDLKIRAAASHGFAGIEIVYGDLEAYSALHQITMATGAEQIRHLCKELDIEILSLCPFENFEGHKSPLKERLELAKHWFNVARILGATYIQVPAQFGKDVIGNEAVIVNEMRQLAELGSAAVPVISIAYEPMSWSTHYSTWEAALRLAEMVDRPNFGICIDSFHIASKMWGNPYEASGICPNGDRDLADSLCRFVTDFPLDRLLYLQLSDGERFAPPFSTEHPWYLEGEAAEFTWSKHARPFPMETEFGGYMPVVEMLKAFILEKRFEGWVSLESFDRRMRKESFEPKIGAERAENSIQKLRGALLSRESRL